MRNLATIAIALIAIISFNACTQDDEFTFTAKEDPEGLMFTSSPSDSYTLSSSNGDNLAERFVWNAVDFGVQTPVTYELQAAPSENFESISIVAQGTETNGAVTVTEMLEVAKEAGLDNDPETAEPNSGTIYFRVRAYVGSDGGNVVDQISEVLAVNVILPEAEEENAPKLHLYLVGDATAAGWNPDNNNTPLFREAENDHIFHLEGRFAGGADVAGFKLLETLGEWQPQWGLSEGNLSNSTILGADPDTFPVASDAFYSFTVNTEEMTYTFEEIDASSATTYGTIGLVGEGTSVGWPSDANPTPDIELSMSTFNEHIWYAPNVTLTQAAVKFRAEKAWDVNWGAETFPSGQATFNGSDIPAQEGTYNVWFNDLSGRYLFIPVSE